MSSHDPPPRSYIQFKKPDPSRPTRIVERDIPQRGIPAPPFSLPGPGPVNPRVIEVPVGGGGGGGPLVRKPEEAYNSNPDPRTKRTEIGRFATPGDRPGEIDLNPNTNYGLNRSFVFLHERIVSANSISIEHASLYPPIVNSDREPEHTIPLIVNVQASGGIPVQGERVFFEFTGDTNARIVDQLGGSHRPNRRAFITRNDGVVFAEYLPGQGTSSPVLVQAVVKDKNDIDVVRTPSLSLEINGV